MDATKMMIQRREMTDLSDDGARARPEEDR
jgi:hypothetical protein